MSFCYGYGGNDADRGFDTVAWLAVEAAVTRRWKKAERYADMLLKKMREDLRSWLEDEWFFLLKVVESRHEPYATSKEG